MQVIRVRGASMVLCRHIRASYIHCTTHQHTLRCVHTCRSLLHAHKYSTTSKRSGVTDDCAPQLSFSLAALAHRQTTSLSSTTTQRYHLRTTQLEQPPTPQSCHHIHRLIFNLHYL